MALDHFADRLADAVRRKKNSLCVGLDPRWDAIPLELRRKGNRLDDVAKTYEEFCLRVIDIVAPLVPVVKPQAAFFESCGAAGLGVLQRVLQHAKNKGLVTILDGKRNDIASTASAYADAAFAGTLVDGECHAVWDADAITVNPYLGRDAVEPFLKSARKSARGVFVLVRTSNPGAGQFQDLVSDGKPLYMHVAAAVGSWAAEHTGRDGFGDVGAVVGATHPDELCEVRKALPNVWFLIPGFGAQGGAAADTAPGFRSDGLGAIINSSRNVIFSYPPDSTSWEGSIEKATLEAIEDLAKSTPMAQLRRT